jgi:hypothetical protein
MLKGFGWGSWAGKGRASLYNAFKAIIRMIPVYGQEVEHAVGPGFVLLYSKKAAHPHEPLLSGECVIPF